MRNNILCFSESLEDELLNVVCGFISSVLYMLFVKMGINSRNLFVLSLSMLFLLTACNKEKQLQKDITGIWDLYQYKLYDNQGFASYYEAEGELNINHFTNHQGTFFLSCIYNDDYGVEHTETYSGTLFTNEGNMEIKTTFDLNQQVVEGVSVVIFHGKDDLKIEFRTPLKRFEVLGSIRK